MDNSALTTFCEFTEQAAGVYHREARSGKYKLTYAEAKAVCEYEGGHLATYKQLEAARKIGNSFDNNLLLFHPWKKNFPPFLQPLIKTFLSIPANSSSGFSHLLCLELVDNSYY